MGELAEHRIRCGPVLLRAYELNPRRDAWPAGTAVALTLSPDDVVVLPYESSDA
jgi:hypothetical protein